MDPYLLKRLWRRPWLSLCSLILSGVFCFLMCFLTGYRQAQQEELRQTQESFEILCVVSNVQGTQTTGLRLWSWAEYFVTSDEYDLHNHVKDLRLTKEYEATCMELGITKVLATGVTNPRCAEPLNPAMRGGTQYIDDSFYTSEERICLVSEEVYSQLGDDKTVSIYLKDTAVNDLMEPGRGTGTYEFEVVGCYNGRGVNIYLPFRTAQNIGVEISGQTYVDSIAFLAADNTRLEELSQAASVKFKTVDPLGINLDGLAAALTIHDEQYRSTVAALEQNIARTGYLLPMILVLSLGVGFLISFLATRGERMTYALMQTLGMTKGRLFLSILREQCFLALLAAVFTAMAATNLRPALWYLLCHSIGCCIAVIRSVRVSPTMILREQE